VVARVAQSEDPGVPVGSQVATYTGWRPRDDHNHAHLDRRPGARWPTGVDQRAGHHRRDCLRGDPQHRPGASRRSIFQMRARSTMALPQPSQVTAESAQLLMHYRERGRYRALIGIPEHTQLSPGCWAGARPPRYPLLRPRHVANRTPIDMVFSQLCASPVAWRHGLIC
jgi:hypothetical protein